MFKTQDFEYDDWVRYKEMFKIMDRMDSFIVASQIADLGFPKFTKEIPTAGVGLHPKTKDVLFYFNKEFFRTLPLEDLAFVFVHEMLHVAFEHYKRAVRINIIKENGEVDIARQKLHNIAADCIVNTWAKNLGFKNTTEEFNEKYMILPEKIGYPDFNSSTTVEDIYHWLCKQNEEQLKKIDEMMSMDVHVSWSDNSGPQMDDFEEKVAGAMREEFFKDAGKNVDKKAFLKKKQEHEAKKKEQASKFVSNYKPSTFGNQQVGELRHFKLLKDRVSTDILRKIHLKIKSSYDIRSKETWSRPPKKLITQWPKFILPYDWELDTKDKYKALLVLDSSGSITNDMIGQAVRFGRSFPLDKIEYIPISFDTMYYELNKKQFYDRTAYPDIPGRGGTDISCPERYIQEVYVKRHKKRPDLVIVITDGMGSHPVAINPRDQKTYLWVMTKNHDEQTVRNYCPGGMIYKTNIQ